MTYYTPRHIIDPASGSGAFLKDAADSVLGNPPYGKDVSELSHYIPIDFNQSSICGLSKDEWKAGTNNWEWVRCPACLEHRPR